MLILSCNTGEGHNSCAKAIKEVFDTKCETCDIEDALRFISDKTSNFISWGHTYVYRHIPSLFNWGYGFTENHTGAFKEQNMLYNFFGKGADELYNFIVIGNYDTVVCVHPFAALMLTETQKRYHLSIKTAFVATDYTCSPSVKDSNLDYYFIPDENLTSEFESTHIPKEKMIVSGIPIRQMFYSSTEKETAKAVGGVPANHRHIVMMCGSMGCGPIEKLTGLLTENGKESFTLTVVCGTNEKLKQRLEKKYGSRKNLQIKGFVKDMSCLLDSADLYLTKAGGISVSEAAVKNLPMIFINAVAGCEEYNSRFFAEYGCYLNGNTAGELFHIVLELLKDEPRYNRIISAMSKRKSFNAAEKIYDTLR